MEQPESILLRKKAGGDLLSARYDNYDPSIEEMEMAFEIAEKIVTISESI